VEAVGGDRRVVQPIAGQQLSIVHLLTVQCPFGLHTALAVDVLAETVAFHFTCFFAVEEKGAAELAEGGDELLELVLGEVTREPSDAEKVVAKRRGQRDLVTSDGVVVAAGGDFPFVPEVGRDVGEDYAGPVGT